MHSVFLRRAAIIVATVVIASALPLTTAASAQASTPVALETFSPSKFDALVLSEEDFSQALGLIEEVPESTLIDGHEATQRWIAENHPEFSPKARGSVLACTAAIAGVIASTAIPVAKILKIKALIKAGGGVAKVVRVYWGASFSYEKIRAIGGAFGALALEIVGIAAIKKGCF